MTTTTNNTRVEVSNKTLYTTEMIYKKKNEASSRNQKGRRDDLGKRIGMKAKLFTCKIEISPMNVRTIREVIP